MVVSRHSLGTSRHREVLNARPIRALRARSTRRTERQATITMTGRARQARSSRPQPRSIAATSLRGRPADPVLPDELRQRCRIDGLGGQGASPVRVDSHRGVGARPAPPWARPAGSRGRPPVWPASRRSTRWTVRPAPRAGPRPCRTGRSGWPRSCRRPRVRRVGRRTGHLAGRRSRRSCPTECRSAARRSAAE